MAAELQGTRRAAARWLEKLQEFNYTIIHRRGHTHAKADALSHMSCNYQRRCPVHSVDGTIGVIALGSEADNIRELQLNDPDIGQVIWGIVWIGIDFLGPLVETDAGIIGMSL